MSVRIKLPFLFIDQRSKNSPPKKRTPKITLSSDAFTRLELYSYWYKATSPRNQDKGDTMSVISALLNVVLVIFIVSTMLVAGLNTTIPALRETFRNITLVVLVLNVNLILVPLIGWGIAAIFSLATPAYIALVLIASSPGGPFGAKLAMIQRGDVVAGSSFQILLATIGSVTFALTANAILTWARLGNGITLPVGDLIKTVMFLQLIPFAIGLMMRHWVDETAREWIPFVLRLSNLTFIAVLALSLLGSWQQILSLLGSLTLIAAILFTAIVFLAGAVIATGSMETKTTLGLVAPVRNAGPIFAAIAIAFSNDPAILGATVGILLMGLVVSLPAAAYLAHRRAAAEEAPTIKRGKAIPTVELTQ